MERGLDIAREREDWEWQLRLLTHLAYARYHLGQLEASLAHYREALAWAVQLQDKNAEALLQGRISAILADQGQMEEAIATAQHSLALALEQENFTLVGEQQILLAFAYRDIDQPDQATAFCQEAIHSFEQVGLTVMVQEAQTLMADLAAFA